MRLINTQTLQLELLTDPVPHDVPYAILSHTWSDDEVTFDDMKDLTIARTRVGFSKIEATCRIAVEHGVQYAWVDTCCIDKSSSAELSEAINSMYRWYKNALLCYAYLPDLPDNGDTTIALDFADCRWFTRGWTLQELIASPNLMFFDKDWKLRGNKSDLSEELEAMTGVNRWVLSGMIPLSSVSIAKRMSWASRRQTTRVEDMAYCLLGIFDVNMPMIYGEGLRAFARLQEKILRKTTDLSLFAWQAKDCSECRGLLADSPTEFSECGNIVLSDDQYRFRDEISMTNRGIKINVALSCLYSDIFIMDLHCFQEQGNLAPKRIGIHLKRTLDTYYRYAPHEISEAGALPGDLPQTRYLASSVEDSMSSLAEDDRTRRISFVYPTDTDQYRLEDVQSVPKTYWYNNEQYFSIRGLSRFTSFLRFRITSRASPLYTYGSVSEESTMFVLVFQWIEGKPLRMSLYAETGLQASPKPHGFLDPFTQLEQYGPLGDPFSLSVLSPGDLEDRQVSMMHRDQRHNYDVTVRQALPGGPPYCAVLEIQPPHERRIPRMQVNMYQEPRPGVPELPADLEPKPDDYRRPAPASSVAPMAGMHGHNEPARAGIPRPHYLYEPIQQKPSPRNLLDYVQQANMRSVAPYQRPEGGVNFLAGGIARPQRAPPRNYDMMVPHPFDEPRQRMQQEQEQNDEEALRMTSVAPYQRPQGPF